MRSLNQKISLYLFALWLGLAAVSVLGYVQLKSVHNASNHLLQSVYPSAAAALEVENAIYDAYQNTIVYCSYLDEEAKGQTQVAIGRADQALKNYFSVSHNTPSEQLTELQALLDDAKNHALDCLRMTDDGMTPAEFQTHIPELNTVQVRVVLALRAAAAREQEKMLQGTKIMDQKVADGLIIFIGGALVMLLIAVIVSRRLTDHILPPIAELTKAAERFSERDLNVQVKENLPGEFHVLARTFNGMAERIHTYIAEEKELQKQLIQSQKLESLGTLSGGIAHDFNNLLTSIMGFSQLAMIDQDPTSKTYQNLERVVKLGGQAAGLTRQLLTFSRRAPMEKNVISPVPLVKETVKVLERTLPETIQMRAVIPRDIANIEADATQIQQVLMNLCVNARDAMLQGGTMIVSLKNRDIANSADDCPAGRYVCLSVKDTGTGIPPDIQERIFEPFFTTKEVGKGTGLGLSIVHGIVKSHGGFIQLHTAKGQGTEFQVFLPAVAEKAIDEVSQNNVQAGDETILLVEDDDCVMDVAKQMLANRGYTVLTATNGVEGLEVFKTNRSNIDLVITDIVMPHMGGIEMSQKMERLSPDIRVLLMSGYAQNQDLFPSAVVGFLNKPFEASKLNLAVRHALDTICMTG